MLISYRFRITFNDFLKIFNILALNRCILMYVIHLLLLYFCCYSFKCLGKITLSKTLDALKIGVRNSSWQVFLIFSSVFISMLKFQ